MPFAVLLVPFFVFAAAFVLLGLSQTHSATQGTSFWQSLWASISGQALISSLLGRLVQAARAVVSRMAGSQLKHMASYLYGMATLWKQTFRAMQAEAQAAAGVASELERAIPREARKAAAPAMARAKVADRHATRAQALAHTVAGDLARYRARDQARVKRLSHAVEVAIPADLAGLRARNKALEDKQAKDAGAIRELEDGAVKTFDWIRSHPLSAVTGIFAGAVSVALARLGFGFLRCRSWQNLGRSLTCNDANILADLLAAATLVVGTMSLVELATEEQKVIRDAADIVRGFWEV